MPKIKNNLAPDEVRELNRQALELMPEVCVFMAAYFGVRQLQRRDLTVPEHKMISRVFKDTVDATYRFGILGPSLRIYHGAYSPFFWRWFNWWHDWLILKHTPQQLEYLRKLADERSPELAEWRPSGDWVAYRDDQVYACPAFYG